ncbi:uncharacterized protein [Choristoneura fumiferana]|uniref:uncharacterized protein n=1 Tax=Choristoneura fumiferana TaxID=7141 RepID=UPI003D15E838
MAKIWPAIFLITTLPTFVFAHFLLWPSCKENDDTILEPGFLVYIKPYQTNDIDKISNVFIFLRDCRFRTLEPYTVQNNTICKGAYVAIDPFSMTDVKPFVASCCFKRIPFYDGDDNIIQQLMEDKIIPKSSKDKCKCDCGCDLSDGISMKRKHLLDGIRHLNLSRNQIYLMDNPELFVSFKYLESLNLASNHIDNMHADVFKTLTHIKNLTLSHNRIKMFPETLFQDLSKLNEVDLSYNFIEYMPASAFHGTALEKLNLSNNKLKYLPTNFFLNKKSLGTTLKLFYFDYNPWYCGCLKDILVDLKGLNIEYNLDRFNGVNAVCSFEKTGAFGCNRYLHADYESNQCLMFSNKPL